MFSYVCKHVCLSARLSGCPSIDLHVITGLLFNAFRHQHTTIICIDSPYCCNVLMMGGLKLPQDKIRFIANYTWSYTQTHACNKHRVLCHTHTHTHTYVCIHTCCCLRVCVIFVIDKNIPIGHCARRLYDNS